MCLFTSARTVAIVFARSAGSEAMYCAGVLTFDGGFLDSSSSRAKCITEHFKTSQPGCPAYQLHARHGLAIWPTLLVPRVSTPGSAGGLDSFVIGIPIRRMIVARQMNSTAGELNET